MIVWVTVLSLTAGATGRVLYSNKRFMPIYNKIVYTTDGNPNSLMTYINNRSSVTQRFMFTMSNATQQTMFFEVEQDTIINYDPASLQIVGAGWTSDGVTTRPGYVEEYFKPLTAAQLLSLEEEEATKEEVANA